MRKLAIFDFCETLIGFQTANEYVEFVLRHNEYRVRRVIYRSYKIINKTKLLSIIYRLACGRGGAKRIPALFLKGISETKLKSIAEEYYNMMLSPAIITPVINELKKQLLTHEVIIVSGGYGIYIDVFAKEFGVSRVIANNLLFVGGVCKGKFGVDVMNEQKIYEIERVYGLNEIDYTNSYFYTDSQTDLPLLNMVGNKIVVSREKHQLWVDDVIGCKEIIWKNN